MLVVVMLDNWFPNTLDAPDICEKLSWEEGSLGFMLGGSIALYWILARLCTSWLPWHTA